MDASTEPTEVPVERLRVARGARRVGIAVLVVLVAAGVLGWLGVESGTVSATNAGTTLSVRYARVVRPGLTAPLVIDIAKDGGFPQGEVVVEISAAYLAAFDWNTVHPEPSDQVREGDLLVWTFPAPEADRLRLTLDVRWNPAVQRGVGGVVGVRESGERVAQVSFRTEVMP